MSTLREEVRPVASTDAGRLAALEARARAEVAGQRGAVAWLAETAPVGDWSGLVGRRDRPVWVATLDDVVVGYLELVVHGDVAEVRQVFVEAEARELGLGDALLGTAIDAARRTGCSRLEGSALPGDRLTKNLYERAGVVARKIVLSTDL